MKLTQVRTQAKAKTADIKQTPTQINCNIINFYPTYREEITILN